MSADFTDGPPTGCIIASNEVMMYWMPPGVPDPIVRDSDDDRPVMVACQFCDETEDVCPECGGTGTMLVEGEPAGLDDLDDRAAEEETVWSK